MTSRYLTIALLAMGLCLAGCSDDPGGSAGDGGDGGSGGSAGAGGSGGGDPGAGFMGQVVGEEGSNFTLVRPDGSDEQIGSNVLFGWINGQLLDGDYSKQLRIGTTIGAMELRMSFPGSASPDGLIEGLHELRPNRLFLEETGSLEERQVEIFFQNSDPPFDPLTNARGTVEIFLDVEVDVDSGMSIYDIAGEVDLDLTGSDGAYRITGFFWARGIDP